MIDLCHQFIINLNKNNLIPMKRNFLSFKTKTIGLLSMAAVLSFTACDNEDPIKPNNQIPAEEVPATYNFANVDYSGQTARIEMLSMLEAKAKEGATTKVTADELSAIFQNTDNLLGTEKNIAEKTASNAVGEIEAYFTSIENLSGNEANVIDGRLYDSKGVEPAQMIAKGLMGALLYDQATAGYLSDAKMDVDNTEVTEGKGTKMQHHWDEAFGYFGAPTDYLTNENSSSSYWAKYGNSRSGVVDVRDELFTAFLEGRTAINNHHIALLNEDEEAAAAALQTRDAAITTIRENWEKLAAANVVHYINSALADLEAGEQGEFFHHWSEGKAFLNTLQYNPDKKVTDADLTELNALLGNHPKESFENATVTKADLEAANDRLQQIFGFSVAEMSNL
jgi:hypothetical protein